MINKIEQFELKTTTTNYNGIITTRQTFGVKPERKLLQRGLGGGSASGAAVQTLAGRARVEEVDSTRHTLQKYCNNK